MQYSNLRCNGQNISSSLGRTKCRQSDGIGAIQQIGKVLVEMSMIVDNRSYVSVRRLFARHRLSSVSYPVGNSKVESGTDASCRFFT